MGQEYEIIQQNKVEQFRYNSWNTECNYIG